MRDGVKLNTEIYIPKSMTTPLPILFTRTPYGLAHDADGFSPALKTSYKETGRRWIYFCLSGYSRTIQIRRSVCHATTASRQGRYKKHRRGQPTHYDTIDWMIKNVRNNNGRVGVWEFPMVDG